MTAETEIQIDLLVDPEWNLILRARFPDQRPPQLGKLPPEYGVEPVPFRITPGPSGRLEQAHWIWHRRDPKRYIMGGAIFHKFGPKPPGFVKGELTHLVLGKDWGFSEEKGGLFLLPDVSKLPPLPFVIEGEEWKERRFLVPLRLDNRTVPEVKSHVQRNRALMASPEGPVDVVVLPNRVDLVWSERVPEAEKWLGEDAGIMWEREFWRGPPPEEDDEEFEDEPVRKPPPPKPS